MSLKPKSTTRVPRVVTGALALAFAVSLGGAAACDGGGNSAYKPPPVEGLDAGHDATAFDGATDGPSDAQGPPDDAATGPTGPCLTTFRYTPPAGTLVGTVAVAGEWQQFAAPGVALVGPDAKGGYEAKVELPAAMSGAAAPSAGLIGYKLLLDGQYVLDPAQQLRKYIGGVENSAVHARDCRVPLLTLTQKQLARPSSGQGHFIANVGYELAAGAVDVASVKVTLKRDGDAVSTLPASVDAKNGMIAIDAASLADGKYTAWVEAKSRGGVPADPLRLVFWVEPEAFDWRDALIYMTMNDRFADGDASNNAAPIANVDPRVSFNGGDIKGVEKAVANGYFDSLGIRAIWMSPFNTNPAGSYKADDNVHNVTGYHGYWPIKGREVDPRLGGNAALKALVKTAHGHGIRILMDYVVNHVHQEHEYFKNHPDWFRTGCVCGTNNCDWTEKRLECLFAPYLPDVNWTVPAVAQQFADDAVWWTDTFDLDGFRLDAVKHVEDVAVRNLAFALRSRFEVAGTRLFMTGETAMGWSDCDVNCNQSQYDTISHAIGPFGLDGQIDFVTYHAVPYRVFAYDQKGMIHADYWSKTSTTEYPAGAIMTPFIGSHDSSRFSTMATYRGQSPDRDMGIAGNKWDNPAGPSDAEGLARHRVALSWLLGMPGAPLMYYGDEYGEYGSADPNNRSMFRDSSRLSTDEQATLAFTRRLGTARKELVALRRGEYRSVYSTEDVLVYARQAGSNVAFMAINRAGTSQSVIATLPVSLGVANGTKLRDRLGGADVSVSSGAISLSLPPRGAALLAP